MASAGRAVYEEAVADTLIADLSGLPDLPDLQG
jgi:hypothetical protein